MMSNQQSIATMKILLTGTTGYIGKRLLPILLEEGHSITCLVRNRKHLKIPSQYTRKIKIIEMDLLNVDAFQPLEKGYDAAYYLIHSMSSVKGDFSNKELITAKNFLHILRKSPKAQIVYLGGIANDKNLSPHLKSRFEVEKVLQSSSHPVTILRAGIIVGSGSASFEIIRDLVEKLPIMVAPKWVHVKSQPIAIRNVLAYLKGVLKNKKCYNRIFDIGGPEILTYYEMLMRFAKVRNYKRIIITVPILTPRLSSYWLYFITSTSFALAKHLVGSMKNEIIASHTGIADHVPQDLLDFEQSVRAAFQKIEQGYVLSSWKDSISSSQLKSNELIDFAEVPFHGCFVDRREFELVIPMKDCLDKVFSIGGNNGWYDWNLLWKIRGYIDKLAGGPGLRRGRRDPVKLEPGDALDFWRVLIANRKAGRLLLYAEMKLPGEAWLEFRIHTIKGKPILIQTATFRPKGLSGRMYWYSVLPLHSIIFKSMGAKLAGN